MAKVMTMEPELPMTGETLLSVEQVAKWLGVSPQTVRNLAQQGKLRMKRIGNLMRFHPQWVRDYINTNR